VAMDMAGAQCHLSAASLSTVCIGLSRMAAPCPASACPSPASLLDTGRLSLQPSTRCCRGLRPPSWYTR
jgi:hypothetical protein